MGSTDKTGGLTAQERGGWGHDCVSMESLRPPRHTRYPVPVPQSQPAGHNLDRLLASVRARFGVAPRLLIRLMTVLKHMLTIIAPKCF